MVATITSTSTSNVLLVDTGDEHTGYPTTTVNPASVGTFLKVNDTLEDAVDVEPSEMKRFNKVTKSAYDLFRSSIQNDYCSVYTSAFQETTEEHKD